MPDPNVLYAVLAVVVASLVGWVIVVLIFAPKASPALPRAHGDEPPIAPADRGPRQPAA